MINMKKKKILLTKKNKISNNHIKNKKNNRLKKIKILKATKNNKKQFLN